jgi:hypothetical protein
MSKQRAESVQNPRRSTTVIVRPPPQAPPVTAAAAGEFMTTAPSGTLRLGVAETEFRKAMAYSAGVNSVGDWRS